MIARTAKIGGSDITIGRIGVRLVFSLVCLYRYG